MGGRQGGREEEAKEDEVRYDHEPWKAWAVKQMEADCPDKTARCK